MAIVQSGPPTTSGSSQNQGASTASAKPVASSTDPTAQSLAAVTPTIDDIMAGKSAIPNVPTSTGPNAALVNAQSGAAEFQAQANQAQNTALGQQLSSGLSSLGQGAAYQQQTSALSNQQTALEQTQNTLSEQQLAQTQALAPQTQAAEVGQYNLGLASQGIGQTAEQQEYGLSTQESNESIANNAAQQQAEAANYALQYGSDPNSQYNLSQTSLQNQLANNTSNYGASVQELSSQGAASGAGNSGQSQLNKSQNTTNYQFGQNQLGLQQNQLTNQAAQAANTQGGELANYNTQQQIAQQQLQSAGIGQTAEQQQYNLGLQSEKVGQSAEVAGYNTTQKQQAEQQKGLALASKQLGLSVAQTNAALKNALAQAGIGGEQLQAQIQTAEASGDANTIASIIQGTYATGALAATPAVKGKAAVK